MPATRVTRPDGCAAVNPGITAGEICVAAANNDGQVCSGDSGGPALGRRGDQWVLLGNASRVTNNDCTGPSVFTDTTYYSGWFGRALADGQPHHPRHVATGAADRLLSGVH